MSAFENYATLLISAFILKVESISALVELIHSMHDSKLRAHLLMFQWEGQRFQSYHGLIGKTVKVIS